LIGRVCRPDRARQAEEAVVFEELLNLPAHPLLVHTAVVFVPLLVLAALVYALVPFARRRITWAVLGLAVVAPLCAWFTTLSGNAFRNRLIARNLAPPEILARIDEHRDLGDATLWAVLGLAVSAVLLVGLLERGWPVARTIARAAASTPAAPAPPRTSRSGPGTGRRVATVVLTVAVVFFAAASLYYVLRTGHTGAQIVWDAF
jgi:hypothetical protein